MLMPVGTISGFLPVLLEVCAEERRQKAKKQIKTATELLMASDRRKTSAAFFKITFLEFVSQSLICAR